MNGDNVNYKKIKQLGIKSERVRELINQIDEQQIDIKINMLKFHKSV